MTTASRRFTRSGAILAATAALPLLLAPSASAASKVCEGGHLPGNKVTTVGVLADQKINIKVHNHDFRGLALSIIDVRFDKTLWNGIVGPGKSKTTSTDVFGEPPISYKIAFRVEQATAVAAKRGELVEKNCSHDKMAVGYFKRARKDAICLRPGTRTWSGMTIYECAGKVVVHLEGSGKQNCGLGLNFKKGSKIVKTVASL